MGKSGEPPVTIIRVDSATPAAPPVEIVKLAPASPAEPPVTILSVAPSTGAPPRQPAPKHQIEALTALFREQRLADALVAARAMARDHPETMTGWNIAGACARALGRLDEAEACFRQLEALGRNFAGAPYNLGLVLEDKRDDASAAAAYARALAIDPSMAQAHNNLGSVLNRMGDTARALAHLERAAALRPELPEVHNSLGNALRAAGRLEEAIAAYRRALATQPGFTKAQYNLGVALQEKGDAEAATAAFREVLKREPENALALLQLAYLLMQACDWDGLAALPGDALALGVETAPVPPFPLLALEDDAARQIVRARNWAKARYRAIQPEPAPFARPALRPERLRIGYFSPDFCNHPAMQLITGPFRAHDRNRFEVHAFSYGPRVEDAGRRKARALVDQFHEVSGQADATIVALARSLAIDIAIDLNGHTRHSRAGLFARRLAPVQVNMLGYPFSMGADFIDYIVTDPYVVPAAARGYYDERLICLPHSYFPTDYAAQEMGAAGTRADHGLPEGVLVLCCFNATYKISPREFDIWMRVLGQIAGSVLWLYRSNPQAERQLRGHAAARGIDPARLIFAGRLPNEAHLERHAHADLFCDTFCYNAHTTAVDALWAGLPVVTRAGEQFAARVAAGLLHAAGLTELVTHTDAEYEALIVELAQDRARLAEVRAKLAAQRSSAPLFDTAQYTRHFEAGLDAAYARWLAGLPPADISVAA